MADPSVVAQRTYSYLRSARRPGDPSDRCALVADRVRHRLGSEGICPVFAWARI